MDSHQPVFSTLSPSLFNERFNLVMNTYWYAGFAPYDQAGISNTTTSDSYSATFTDTIATVTDTTSVFLISVGWIIVLFVSSSILLIAGVANAILDARTVGPDVAGFVNPLLMRSKEMTLPHSASAVMDSVESAKLLADVKVMVQDAEPTAEVGRIVLGTKRKEEGAVGLNLKRLYR